MKHVLTLLILMAASLSMCIAQSVIPGQKAFESAFGTNVDLNLEKCCIAAHGWHIASEIKFEGITPTALKSNEVAQELLKSNIVPIETEQYFTTPDGRIVVVYAQDQFDKVYGRFLINLNATNR